MSETHQTHIQERTPEQLLTDGFFPLLTLASKYGYAKDHIGRLARTGRVQAIRFGNKGDWFVNEASLEKYHRAITKDRFAPVLPESKPHDHSLVPAHVEDVELQGPTVLSNDEGSINAEPSTEFPRSGRCPTPRSNVQTTLPRGIYAILTLAIVLGGVFVSYNFGIVPALSKHASDRNANILEVVGRPFAVLWDWLFNTIDEPENYLVLRGPRTTLSPTATSIPTPGSSPAPFPSLAPTASPTPALSPKPPVIITQGASKADIAALQSRLNDHQAKLNIFDNTLLSLQNQITGVNALTFDLTSLDKRISDNAAGISAALLSISTYPKRFETEKLTVTKETSFSSLTVSGNAVFDTNTLFVDAANNRVGIGTTSPGTTFEVIGAASISQNLTVGGNVTINGNSITGPELSVTGSGSFTGRLTLNNSPTVAHTGTWPNFTGLTNSTLFLNPSSPIADGNIIAYANGNDAKFVVDTEGDVFARNLVLTGSTTQGTTTIAGDLNIEGNARIGDAPGDQVRIVGTVLPHTLTSNIFTIQASPSWTGDWYFRALDSSSTPIFTIASTSDGYLGGNLTVAGAASSSFAGSLDITKGLRAANFTQVGSGVSYFNGNVGIGTTNPTTKFDVIGNASISQNLEVRGTTGITASISNTFLVDGANKRVGIITPAQAGVAFRVGGSEYSYFDSGIQTGLGLTQNTISTMTLGGGGSATFKLNAIGGGTTARIEYQSGGTTRFYGGLQSDTGPFTITTDGGSNGINITQTGNVGIGTTGPGAKLHVSGGNILLDNNQFVQFKDSPSGTIRSILGYDVDETVIIRNPANGGVILWDGVQTHNLTLYAGNSPNVQITSSVAANTKFNNNAIQIGNSSSSTYAKLEVVGQAASNYFKLSSAVDADGDIFTVAGTGNVGIGTSSPTAKLSISSSTATASFDITSQGQTDKRFTLRSNYQGSGTSERLSILNGAGTELFTIASTGNVGIGTTAPSAKLHVNGTPGISLAQGLVFGDGDTGFWEAADDLLRITVGGITQFQFGVETFRSLTNGSFSLDADNVADQTVPSYGFAGDENTGMYSPGADTLGFTTGGAEKLRITSSGNVGIGTTSPTALTHIVGDTSTLLNVASGSNSRFVVMESGNVGIGTTNPSVALEVAGRQSNFGLFPVNLGGSSSAYPGIAYNVNFNTGGTHNYRAGDTASLMQLYDGGFRFLGTSTVGVAGNPITFTDFMVIDKDGDVGIATGPGATVAKLHVNANQQGKTVLGDSRIVALTDVNGGLNNRSEIGIGYKNVATYQPIVIGHKVSEVGDFTKGDFYIATRDVTTDTAPTERFYITAAGNIGIGTTSPATRLDVIGAAGDNPIANFASASGTSALYIDKRSRVGFGTDSPTSIVHVWSTSAFPTINIEGTTTAGGILQLTSSTNNWQLYNGSGKLQFDGSSTSGVEFTMDTSGNVGIGTTVPGARLEVVGDNATLFNVASGSNSRFAVLESGNVGIGTTGPSALLHVQRSTAGTVAILRQSAGGGSPILQLQQNDGTVVGSFGPTGNTVLSNTGGSELGKLTVYGDASAKTAVFQANAATPGNILELQNSAGTPLFLVKGDGNVGIGTSAPTALTSFYSTATASFDITSQGQADKRFTLRSNYQGSGASERLSILNGAGTELVSVASSGFVGIGTTNPLATLNVAGILLLGDSTNQFRFNQVVSSSGLTFNSNSASNIMFLDRTSGNVGIGTTGPSQILHIRTANVPVANQAYAGNVVVNTSDAQAVNKGGSISIGGSYTDAGDQWTWGVIHGGKENGTTADSAGYLRFFTNAAGGNINERMRITSSGNVGIGTTIPELILDVEGDIEVGTGTTGCVRDADNTTIAGTCSSDIRLKTNIQPLGGVLEKLTRLNPVTFDWIDGANQTPNYGFIAQEVQQVMPELVASASDGFLRVRYDTTLTTMFLKGIQELDSKMASLSMRLEEIENRSASGSFADIDPGSAFGDWLTQSLAATRTMLSDGSLEIVKAVNGVFDKLQANEIIVGDFEADHADVQTLEVHRGITIFDSITGEPVCVVSESGVLKSIPGKCAMTTPTPTPTPSAGGSSGGEPSPTPTPQESPPTPEAAPSPTPSPSTTPEPEPSVSPSPSPSPTPNPEQTPEVTPAE